MSLYTTKSKLCSQTYPRNVSKICTDLLITNGGHVPDIRKIFLHILAIVDYILCKQQFVGRRVLQKYQIYSAYDCHPYLSTYLKNEARKPICKWFFSILKKTKMICFILFSVLIFVRYIFILLITKIIIFWWFQIVFA